MYSMCYIILIRPDTNSFINAEISIGKIRNYDDLQEIRDFVLKSENVIGENDKWFVLNWKRFEDE